MAAAARVLLVGLAWRLEHIPLISIQNSAVIAGLDPAIHHRRENSLRRMMDARVKPWVKPAGDGCGMQRLIQTERNAL
jgi:hypothetical protein